MSLTLLRENSKKVISIFSISLFAILAFFFNVNIASASPLNACGEIAVSGTYTLSSDLGTTGINCLTISTGGVVIDGVGLYMVVGNISGNVSYYSLVNMASAPTILSDFSYNNASADGNWANTANWTTAALPTSVDDAYVSGNVSSYAGGKALSMNGSGWTTVSPINMGTSHSVEFWFKSSVTQEGQVIIGDSTYSASIYLYSFQIRYYTNANYSANWDIGNLYNGTWHHLVFVRNGLNVTFYKNGVSQGTRASGGTNTATNFSKLGTRGQDNFGGKLNGLFDEVVLWNKQLTGAEVTARYNSGAGAELTNYTNVFAEYRLNNNYNDSSPNARNMSAGGTGNSFAAGALLPSPQPFPIVQRLYMSSGTNSTTIRTTAGATFSGTAVHNGTVYGNATFLEDTPTMGASARASVTYPTDDNAATLTRIYTTNATTTKDFTLNGGRWIIESDGAKINLAGATYSVSTTTYQSDKNVFRAKNGATFTENSSINGGAHVVPKVVINSPVAGVNNSWRPNVSWDDADTCEYKWGAGGTYTAVNCAAAGSDIPRPVAFATTTLYVKGTYNDTSYSEQLVQFSYDNISPLAVNCDYTLDEASREYYYLDSNITGNCTAITNIILKGNINPSLPGYSINGQLVASATSTGNGFNVTLENITITGTTTASGIGAGNHGGNITVADSSLGNIVTNGGSVSLTDSSSSVITTSSDTTGVYAGSITIDNSTTSNLNSNSLDSGKDGGDITVTNSNIGDVVTNGGAISVTNSVTSQLASNSNSGGILGGNVTVTVSTTTDIYANGGDITVSTSSVGLANSTSPTAGIAGGDVSITVSTAGDITTNGGAVTITDSTISAINADGISGIANAGAVSVTNSTLTSISANGTGSGSRGGHVTVTDSNPTSIATNGGNVLITNVTTGDINASGNSGGISAGTISIEFSTTTAIYANGGENTSGNGGNGATITIATSTTGLIEASGADAEGDGGDGGTITITNSIGTNVALTPITANGGDSTSCGNGGDSGVITIVNTTYGTITAEPGLGDNSGCSSSTKISGVRNTVTTVGDGHPSIPRSTPSSPSPTPSNTVTIGGGINRFFNQGLNGINFAPIQNFNLFGDDFNKTFKPIDVGLSRFPKVFTDLRALGSMLLDKMPVNLLPNLQKFILEPANPDKLTGLMPNASRLLAAVGVTRSQELASLMRSPKLITDIENPEKYGLFKVYSGDVLVNTYVTYEKAVDKLAQLIKSAPSQILYIGTTVAGNITDESKMPYIMYQGQKKILTPTFDKYYATSIVTPTLEGRYLIETSTDVQIILDVLPQNNSNEQSKPWGIFNKLWKIFH